MANKGGFTGHHHHQRTQTTQFSSSSDSDTSSSEDEDFVVSAAPTTSTTTMTQRRPSGLPPPPPRKKSSVSVPSAIDATSSGNTNRETFGDFSFDRGAAAVAAEEEEKAYSVYHIFNIRTNHRDSLRNHLNINQIQTLIHYPIPPHKQNCFQEFEFSEHSYPIAEELSRTSLSLPIWPGMSIDEVDFISSKIQLFFKNQTPKIN